MGYICYIPVLAAFLVLAFRFFGCNVSVLDVLGVLTMLAVMSVFSVSTVLFFGCSGCVDCMAVWVILAE